MSSYSQNELLEIQVVLLPIELNCARKFIDMFVRVSTLNLNPFNFATFWLRSQHSMIYIPNSKFRLQVPFSINGGCLTVAISTIIP